MLVGCAWVWTADQNPDHQIDALLRAGIDRDNIHVDTTSGAKASRPKLDLVLQLLKSDRLKVTRPDRLSRSVLHMVTPRARPTALRRVGVNLAVAATAPISPDAAARFVVTSFNSEFSHIFAYYLYFVSEYTAPVAR
ncbi:MAG: recombinase family protein [Mycobacterium sp.]